MLVIIFVGGIHGVGKTYLCEKISNHLNIEHYSSSKLIFEQANQNPSIDKKVISAIRNQELLTKALENISKLESMFLLDGHCCLLNKNGDIEKIPLQTFEKINPKAMIIIIDSIDIIFQRLHKRDNLEYDYQLLSNFQDSELAYSKVISRHLDIPLFIHTPNTSLEKVSTFILTVIKS